ncbi:hypothetical protein B0H16DRAFT_1478065 [Mycena metata]|uniref:Uncharacterized protein n=1 Tax=Mycena metata TaxID=1033252 RepID=A0AAD7MF64_9AGAR|nr:hypothetical protein B0H16DRAFT_1478065 [Mycena metata]
MHKPFKSTRICDSSQRYTIRETCWQKTLFRTTYEFPGLALSIETLQMQAKHSLPAVQLYRVYGFGWRAAYTQGLEVPINVFGRPGILPSLWIPPICKGQQSQRVQTVGFLLKIVRKSANLEYFPYGAHNFSDAYEGSRKVSMTPLHHWYTTTTQPGAWPSQTGDFPPIFSIPTQPLPQSPSQNGIIASGRYFPPGPTLTSTIRRT